MCSLMIRLECPAPNSRMFRSLQLMLTLETLCSPAQCRLIIVIRSYGIIRCCGIFEGILFGFFTRCSGCVVKAVTGLHQRDGRHSEDPHLLRFRLLKMGTGFGSKLSKGRVSKR